MADEDGAFGACSDLLWGLPSGREVGADGWERLIAFASAHLVLPALAAPVRGRGNVPDDIRLFLDAMEGANRARNQQLKDELLAVAGALNAIGVTPLVLKGGAFLVDGTDTAASWRFMSDLDLLVPERRLLDCVAAVGALGFKACDRSYDRARDAHYPPLARDGEGMSLELHTRLFGAEAFAPDIAAMVDAAAPVDGIGARVLLPAPLHRVQHLLAHAQLHNRFYPARRLMLRDLLDLDALDRQLPGGVLQAAVLAGFASPLERVAVGALLDSWRRLRRPDTACALGAGERAWSEAAIARLELPASRSRLSELAAAVRTEAWRARREPGYVRERVRLLMSPRRIAYALSSRRAKAAQARWG